MSKTEAIARGNARQGFNLRGAPEGGVTKSNGNRNGTSETYAENRGYRREQEKDNLYSRGFQYRAVVWHEALKIRKYQDIIDSVQRKMVIRVARGYRTVTLEAIRVIARTIPLDLIAEERKNTFGRSDRKRRERERETEHYKNGRRDGRRRNWVEKKHREVDYHIMTQARTGHGCFKNFLYVIGKAKTEISDYCDMEDSAEHILFYCQRWEPERFKVILHMGHEITAENMIPIMLETPSNWEVIKKMLWKIMRKEEDEREKKGKQHTR
ncbi:hypothetical protein NQ314_001075 [Rhamnusium bicolor]|uniref:Reverse transcriptase domain-containing protein n=1 Tax=Rhamnusium bicolor TaxID=1586634 RepID=A0AAV8ZSU8_9CUCU|nr:hypothetical protein NQ314_001075 [Rhamnusium bicolor]